MWMSFEASERSRPECQALNTLPPHILIRVEIPLRQFLEATEQTNRFSLLPFPSKAQSPSKTITSISKHSMNLQATSTWDLSNGNWDADTFINTGLTVEARIFIVGQGQDRQRGRMHWLWSINATGNLSLSEVGDDIKGNKSARRGRRRGWDTNH